MSDAEYEAALLSRGWHREHREMKSTHHRLRSPACKPEEYALGSPLLDGADSSPLAALPLPP